ncbi:UPF0193 protein EVG1 [Betta splendens]|uniref:UPF0193 protein EVG1 n=1 Tax=Betta splendens TaxID=158456 RepID=A0A6P7MIJ9_BETSP|nr:UPF0193 protein EVG1 [Betta splendens]XP_055367380.1 UPF0193 protein EVG1 [Betta splendens]
METSSQARGGGGLWNKPRAAQYSKETQDMLRLMMQESRLTTLQRKQINECLKNGAALPLTPDPTPSSTPPAPKSRKSVQVRLPGKPQRRSAESCRSGNSYTRDRFHPGPTRDLEKEKKRLQSILSNGHDKPPSPTNAAYQSPEVSEDRDRYQEVLDEIEERRQFLADMASLGQEKKYINIINTEISQKIRELEMLDNCSKKNAPAPERKE